MITPDRSDLGERARRLLEDARAVEVAVDSSAAELFRLGGEVARAATRGEAARSGAHVAAARDVVNGLLEDLAAIASLVDRLASELDRMGGSVDARGTGAVGAGARGTEASAEARGTEASAGARGTLDSVRRVIDAADDRGRECRWMGELATDRVRDFAEFELLHSQASQHLDRNRLDAADAVIPRLVALDRALVSMEVGTMLDELKFRLMTSRE
ncbi:hypothetical protein [Dietzia sp. B32]|uniref:hypothetical protein n=1 Tax=Dietzia sp. B32 TaxID=2915130 RepID=UPI0021ADF88D|nr:hypothetical protein [Dietzia sp. B32]UVE96620.1 hypothetical protein L8M95_07625 [Dietzia sp. B32]